MSEVRVPRIGFPRRVQIGLVITTAGLLVYLIGVAPWLFGLDRSPVTGFVQITVFLIGLAFICLGGYISLSALWNGSQKSIAADIGLRLVSTGYVIAFGSGMADVFGFGSQSLPKIPSFGPWQALGVMIGLGVIGIGFILLIPFKLPKPKEEEQVFPN